jgi:hypothetical protein
MGSEADILSPSSLISLQLPLSPMMFFAIWIEHALLVAVDRSQRRRAREQRIALLGGAGHVIRRRQHHLMVPLGSGHRLGEIMDRIAQRLQLRAIVEHDIGLEPVRQARLVGRSDVAARARRSSAATGAGVRAGPRLVGTGLADPAAVITEQALHRAVALPGARSLGGLREFHNVFGCPFQGPCFLFAAHQRIQNLNWTNPLSACHCPVRGIYR